MQIISTINQSYAPFIGEGTTDNGELQNNTKIEGNTSQKRQEAMQNRQNRTRIHRPKIIMSRSRFGRKIHELCLSSTDEKVKSQLHKSSRRMKSEIGVDLVLSIYFSFVSFVVSLVSFCLQTTGVCVDSSYMMA